MIRPLLLATAILATTAGVAPAQTAFSPDHLVTITVSRMDRPLVIPAHTIRIEATTSRVALSQQELEGRAWRAVRLSELGEETVSSTDCPGLGDAALAFARLAAVPIAPPTMRVETAPLPIPPTPKDGFDTRLAFRTLTADGSEATVELHGGTAYWSWAQTAVDIVGRCLGPWPPAA